MTDLPRRPKKMYLALRRNGPFGLRAAAHSCEGAEGDSCAIRHRLLVVDDDPLTLAMLEKVLSQYYEVVCAADGREALEKLRADSFSMVISDAMMPRMSGLELISAMQEDAALNCIPIIIVTAYGNIKNMKKALDLGAVDVINKPFLPEILLRRVRNLIHMRESARTSEQNKLYEQQIRQQSRMLWKLEHDELTGLYNRQAFYRKIRERMAAEKEPRRYMFLRWDIDDFTIINDAMGVEAGDRLLRCIGQKMLMHRRPDILMGHIESDHFVAFLDSALIDPIRLFGLMQNWLTTNLPEYKANFRMGVYFVDSSVVNPATMCDRAFFALRSSKGSYTNRISFYSDSMREQLMEIQRLTKEMLPGLRDEQFEVYYQPLYNYGSGELIGAEALVRWNHPTEGLLTPGVFLPLFERNGFVSQLDSYVWERVCRQLRIWIDRYGDRVPPVSVNVSRMDAHSGDLCKRLCALMEKYHLPFNKLRLEITESAYMKDAQGLSETVKSLSDAGFLIEMDDFGSAYSSLNMLKDIPVDILKLDMKFLSDTQNSVRSGNILSSVIRMARWLKLPVIAEGVETKAQADYLESIGCLYMQGYYFSVPVKAASYEEVLARSAAGDIGKYKDVDFRAAESFWDASSLTALVFNSYAGGAAILEQNGASLEMLRANDRFFEIVRTTREQYQPFMLNFWSQFERLAQSNYQKMLDHAAVTGQVSSCEIMTRTETGECIWTSNRAKLLARNMESKIFYVSVEDITAQKKAEAGLIRQKELLDRLYNGVPCGIVDYSFCDDTVRMLNFNDTVWKQFGYRSRMELQSICSGGHSPMRVHPDDISQVQDKMREALTSDRYTTVECRLQHKDGTYGWYEVRLQRELSQRGAGTLQSVLADIGDRKEQELLDYSKMLFSVFTNVYLLDYSQHTCRTIIRDSVIQTSAPVQTGLTGILEDWMDKILPEYRDGIRRFLNADALTCACQRNTTPVMELQCRWNDGSIRWMRDTILMIEHNRFLCCMQDISREKRSEELARQNAVLQASVEQQERYRVMVEQTGFSVVEWNFASGEFFHSDGYRRYALSRDGEENFRRNVIPSDTVHPDDRDRLERFLASVGKGAAHSETIMRLLMQDGTYRWTQVRHEYIRDENGVPQRSIGTLIDMDDEIRAEEKEGRTSAHLEQVIAELPIGVAVYRMEAGRIVPDYISECAAEMFGSTRSELMHQMAEGRPLSAFLPDFPAELIHRLCKDGSLYVPQMRANRCDGSEFWLRIACVVVSKPGVPALCYTGLFDVTDNVEQEQRLCAAAACCRMMLNVTGLPAFDYDVGTDLLHLSMARPEGGRDERNYPEWKRHVEEGDTLIEQDSRAALLEELQKALNRRRDGKIEFSATDMSGTKGRFSAEYAVLTGEDDRGYRVTGLLHAIPEEE